MDSRNDARTALSSNTTDLAEFVPGGNVANFTIALPSLNFRLQVLPLRIGQKQQQPQEGK